MKLPGTMTDYFPASASDASTAQSVERLHEADEGTAWWWCQEQAISCPAQWAVLETNQVLDHLEAVQYVVSQMTGVNVVVPQAVVEELELLEGMERLDGGRPAGAALRYLRSELQSLGGYRCSGGGDRSSLLMQNDSEALYNGLHGSFDGVPHSLDDDVLACVRYFAVSVAPHMTELMTSDRRLAIKAAFHGVPSESVIMLMGRSIMSPAECQALDAECLLEFGAPDGPPGLAAPVRLAADIGHAVDDYNWSTSDAVRETEKVVQRKGDDALAADSQDSVHISLDESSCGGSCARTLEAINAGKQAGHGCATSTRSPSSDDGSSDPIEVSPDVSVLDSPPGLPQATPPWHHVPDIEHDDELEWDDVEQKDERRVWKSAAKESPPRTDASGSKRHAEVVVLRGLPFNVTEEEVLAFIHEAGVSRELLAPQRVVALLANAQGRPSGFAEVRLAHGANLRDVRVRLHMQHLRGRYIEALPPRPLRKSATKRQAWWVKQ